MPEYLRLDMFPATVTRGDGSVLDPVRAVVTDSQLYVFMDGNPRPQEELIVDLYDYEVLSRTHSRVITDNDKEQIEITKRAGCGCGNKLRGFRPFPGVPLLRNK